jgi:hypothetical protein
MEDKYPILGNFIECGKFLSSEGEYLHSFIRLSCIKTIHEGNNKKNKGRIFFTYKDEAYAVNGMTARELTCRLNDNIDHYGDDVPNDVYK